LRAGRGSDKIFGWRRLIYEISARQKFYQSLNPNPRVAASHRQRIMKTIATNPETFESTYALLVRSEEKQRSRFETLVYMLLIFSTTLAVLQFAATTMPSSIAHVSTSPPVELPHG
jgi:hypothetical protein